MKRAIFEYNSPFVLESGQVLENLEICYHYTDNISEGKEVIWVCHALTANSNPLEWWSDLVGEGKLFDTRRYTVICANVLGSCYGSSGPASFKDSGDRYLLSFPEVTVRDTVRAHNLLREHLGIKNIDLILGGSIGGFQALEWGIIYPDVVKNIVLIACNARVSPWGTAFNESQRMALFADSSFEEQRDLYGGKAGLAAARSIALLSYRSVLGYGLTQKESDDDTIFAQRACSYQQYQGKKLVDRFDAYSYYTLTKSIDSHNVGRGRGGVEEALKKVIANTLIIGIDSDLLFPIEEQKYLHSKIEGSGFEQISSEFGHDGFLLEWERIETAIKKHIKFLN
ncbi:MAG: homoserine O-acetyltransferase [Bacteroidetes bacterium GWF2_40_14]|nr:MAG: homoserine O-acetyltransferase [Bacteroidetes bacterium GWF2_40_14]